MPQYLSPGVYVEEVEAGSRPIEGVGTAVAAFVGLAAQGPFNEPTLVTNWSQFTQTFGDFVDGSYLGARRLRLLQQRRRRRYVVRIGAGRPGAGRPRRAEERRRRQRRRVPRDRARGGRRPATTSPSRSHSPQGDDAPDDIFTLQVKRGGNIEETFEGLTTKKGKQNAATVVNAQSKLIQLEEIGNLGFAERRPAARRGHARRRRRPGARARAARRLRRRQRRPHRLRRPRGDRHRHDGLGPRPDGRLPGRHDRPRGRAGRAPRDDRPLRADGRPRRDPRSAAGPERAADPRVARRQGRLRLQVRDALLAVDQGLRSARAARPRSCRRRATWPASGAATTTRAACTRRPRTRSSAARSRSRRRSPRPSTTC